MLRRTLCRRPAGAVRGPTELEESPPLIARRQPPVYSPLTAGALASAFRAALGGGRDRAESAARALIRRRYGARRVTFTDSGTSALTLALRAARADAGPRVSVPAFSCYDVGTAWKGAGVSALLYDLDPETLSPDLSSLRATVESGAGAVVVANLYGVPLDWHGIRRATEPGGVLVIEDAAQGGGCRWEGERAGSLGDLAVLSFGRGKGWTAGGGGALLSLSDRGDAALSSLGRLDLGPSPSASALARALAQWGLARPRLYGLPASLPGLRLGETVYHPPSAPAGASTFSLGLLAATGPLRDREVAVRRQNARRLTAILGHVGGIRPIRGPEAGEPGFLRLPVLADGRTSTRLGSRHAEALGVMPSYPRPLHRLPPLRDSLDAASVGRFEGAERIARSLYTLPTHSLLGADDLRELERLLRGPSGARRGPRPADAASPPRELAVFAVLSVASLVAYLVLSEAVGDFVRVASSVLETLLEVLGRA